MVVFKPNKNQLYIMKHALGLTDGNTEYRNHYVAGEGHHSMADLVTLETECLMRRVPTPGWMDKDDIVFMVTNDGKAFCKGTRR